MHGALNAAHALCGAKTRLWPRSNVELRLPDNDDALGMTAVTPGERVDTCVVLLFLDCEGTDGSP